jgi:hypothetical protein
MPPWGRGPDDRKGGDRKGGDRKGGSRRPEHGRPADRGPGSGRPIRRAGLGLLYLAIGRREGFEDFGNTTDAYLASLAPLVAFALVSSVLAAASGAVHVAVLGFLVLLCSWLGPAVISHPLVRRWGRAGQWPRYANILNWAQMLMFLIFSAASALARVAVAGGVPAKAAVVATLLGVSVYALWFQWFVARGVVGVSRWRTVLLLAATLVGTNMLISVPLVATGNGWQSLMR